MTAGNGSGWDAGYGLLRHGLKLFALSAAPLPAALRLLPPRGSARRDLLRGSPSPSSLSFRRRSCAYPAKIDPHPPLARPSVAVCAARNKEIGRRRTCRQHTPADRRSGGMKRCCRQRVRLCCHRTLLSPLCPVRLRSLSKHRRCGKRRPPASSYVSRATGRDRGGPSRLPYRGNPFAA